MLAAGRSAVVRALIRTVERVLPRLERALPRLGIDVLDKATAASARAPRRRRLEVVTISPSTVVLNRPRLVRQERLAREKELFDYLGTSHIAGVLHHYGVNCVIDVGANRGSYGRMLRAAGYKGHIVSFEPVPHLARKLRQAAKGDKKWSVHRVALGTQDGVVPMHVVPKTKRGWRSGMSSILPPTETGIERYEMLSALSPQEVPIRRLDGLLDEVTARVKDPRLFLKLDTQGYDLQVFEGLGERAAEFVAMQSEMALVEMYENAPPMTKALETYMRAGFSVSGFFLVTRDWTTWAAAEFDCIMVRASALPK